MKKILFSLFGLLLLSGNIQANNDIQLKDLSPEQAKFVAGVAFDRLQDQGAFDDVDASSLKLAKEFIQTIVSDQNIMNDLENATLVLDDQFVADYFLKDTISTIKDKVTRITDVLKPLTTPIKDAASSLASGLKGIAGKIASIANKTLTYITGSDAIMTIIQTSVGVINTLIPWGANALGLAIITFAPEAAVLIPLIAAATPILKTVVTPDNVTTALKVGAAVASLADSFLNKDKASFAPSMMALEAKSGKKPSPKQAGEGVILALQGGKAVEKYIKKAIKSGEWNKLSNSQKKNLLDTVNKANRLAGLIDVNKLK